MAEGKKSDYACVAIIEVPENQQATYDALINQAAKVFTESGWELEAAGLSNEQTGTTAAPPPGLVSKLLNVWSIPGFDTLPEVMAHAADSPFYVKAQSMTLAEAQNLYVKLRWDSPIGLPEKPITHYMTETLHMVNGTAARENFANYMDEAIY